MKIWIYIDGRQEGPYTLEELLDKPVDENTKVWFEGLPKWYPAGYLDELKPLFDGSLRREAEAEADAADEAGQEAEQEEAVIVEETMVEEPVAAEPRRYAPGQRYVHRSRPDSPCPPTYIGWTIFLAICCCSPLSLAGLVASICVSTYYNSGRLDKARKASEVAVWLVMISIALGMGPMMLMSVLIGG